MVRVEKEKIKKARKNDEVNPQARWMGLFLLFIMVFSVAGFAFITGGGILRSGNSNDLPRELPLQRFEEGGQVFWATIRNNELFVFDDIAPLEADLEAEFIAEQIRNRGDGIEIYVEPTISLESGFIFEKSLRALRISHSISGSSDCSANKVILSSEGGYSGDCLLIIFPEEEYYQRMEAVAFHLVK